jgi:aspartate ammonia-lyase
MRNQTTNDMAGGERLERDALGELPVPSDALYGIHTRRAALNFPFSGYAPHPALVAALAQVKHACARANLELGFLEPDVAEAIITACQEVAEGQWGGHFVVDPFQGGAGTSMNMNANEVLANRDAARDNSRRRAR